MELGIKLLFERLEFATGNRTYLSSNIFFIIIECKKDIYGAFLNLKKYCRLVTKN